MRWVGAGGHGWTGAVGAAGIGEENGIGIGIGIGVRMRSERGQSGGGARAWTTLLRG